MAVGGTDGTIKIWNMTDDSVLENLKAHKVNFYYFRVKLIFYLFLKMDIILLQDLELIILFLFGILEI